MEEPLLRYKSMAPLLCEADLEGMAFNTPVPFYDTTVACGNPKDTEEVLPVMMLMPDEVLGPYDVYCTRANGDSMKDLEIYSGDLLLIEKPPVYESRDIVLDIVLGTWVTKRRTLNHLSQRVQLVSVTHDFKFEAPDGKQRFADALDSDCVQTLAKAAS